MLDWFLLIAGAYAVGSIPFGLLIARTQGVDIRAHGSGNIGATNVGRVLGRRFGITCLILDALKGALPVLAAGHVSAALYANELADADAWGWIGVAMAAIAGHIYPVWIGFKGGKGVATSLGALLGLWPMLTLPAAGAAAVWGTVLVLTRYVGVASCAAAVSIPLLVTLVSRTGIWGDRAVVPAMTFSLVLAALVIWRHRGNLARTLRGTEPKSGSSYKPTDAP